VRTDRYRYIRYYEGSEELYDLHEDPNEWTNLAGLEKHAALKKELAKWLPKENAEPAKGAGGGRKNPRKRVPKTSK
jgi:hypothetical protein